MNQKYPAQVGKWGVFEVALEGPSEGNPFTEQYLNGIFSSKNESVVTEGFYDGDGVYRIRFMPSYEGKYTFILKGSFLEKSVSGAFYAVAPEEGNQGVVRTAGRQFAYEDGTAYYPLGTTAYAWALQSDEQIAKTLASLEEAGFTKLRFCIFPKHYAFNLTEPRSYPYEGTPMDSSVLTEENFLSYFGKNEGNDFDCTRFNPAYFRHLEYCIEELGKRGVEADLICLHPYDRWGFSEMSAEEDDLYFRYIAARFSAYHNVWWSLANEYDLMKTKSTADWERLASVLVKKDPYRHLRSIHNCRTLYDHSRPWITHCSVQRVDLYKGAEYTGELCEKYGKPVIMDELGYEGDIPFGFGSLTAEEETRRFWETALRGGYPGHGETYLSEDNLLWWSHGGELKGESWKRAGFLLDIVKDVPGGIAETKAQWDEVCGTPAAEWMQEVKSQYIFYYSFMRPSYRDYHIDDETDFIAEIIDTWNMTVRKAGIHKGAFRVELPAKQYIAVRLRRPTEEDYLNPVDEEEEEIIEEEVIEEEAELTEEDLSTVAAFEALETVDDSEPEETEESAEEAEEIPAEEDLEKTEALEEIEETEEPDFVDSEEENLIITADEVSEEAEGEEEPEEEAAEEIPAEPEKPAYVYKHAAPGYFAENVDEEIPEYTVPGEAEDDVLVEEYPESPADPESAEDTDLDINLAGLPEDDEAGEELPDIVSGAIEKVSSYDDRTPILDDDDDDVLGNLIDEAEKTLDIPIVGFQKDNG